MQIIEIVRLIGTTAVGGAATITADRPIRGFLVAVEWVDGDLTDGVDGTLSVIRTSSGVNKTLLTLTDANADAWYQPREDRHSASGAAASVNDQYMIVDGVLQLVIARGGDAHTGGALVYLF